MHDAAAFYTLRTALEYSIGSQGGTGKMEQQDGEAEKLRGADLPGVRLRSNGEDEFPSISWPPSS